MFLGVIGIFQDAFREQFRKKIVRRLMVHRVPEGKAPSGPFDELLLAEAALFRIKGIREIHSQFGTFFLHEEAEFANFHILQDFPEHLLHVLSVAFPFSLPFPHLRFIGRADQEHAFGIPDEKLAVKHDILEHLYPLRFLSVHLIQDPYAKPDIVIILNGEGTHGIVRQNLFPEFPETIRFRHFPLIQGKLRKGLFLLAPDADFNIDDLPGNGLEDPSAIVL